MNATLASRVYATVISNQGLTSREINKVMGPNPSIAKTLSTLVARGALTAVPGEGSRSTRYYKGSAPVILRQADGQRQKNIQSAANVAKMQLDVKTAIESLQAIQKQLTLI